MAEPLTIVGRARVVAGPEKIQPNDANKPAFDKWTVVMENGSTMNTYSQRCADAIDANLDFEMTFDCERTGDFPPKVVKLTKDGEVLYDKNAGGGGGGRGQRTWVDTTPSQNARHALGSASATIGQIEAARIAAGQPAVAVEQLLMDVSKLAQGYLETIEELTK